MECTPFRDALSARLDGEDPGLPDAAVDHHLDGCPACRRWLQEVTELDRRVRIHPADQVPDLVPAVAATIGRTRRVPWWQPAWPWRATLAVMGAVQVVLGLPVVLAGSSTAGHLGHELGAWTVALGAGFLYAAWRPSKAAGLVPFVGALVAFLFVTTTRDVLAGRAGLVDEVSHLFEAFGFFVLWMVARLAPPPAPRWRRGLHPA